MARSILKSLRISTSAGRGIARMIRHVERSSEKVFFPADLPDQMFREHPAIIAFWHGQFMMVASLNTHDAPVAAMVARHGDADLIGNAMAELGVELIRGAGSGGKKKDKGGAQALRLAVRALEDGKSLCMTADVPPGPARRAGAGIITLARLSGRPIFPVAIATSRFIALDTWSRMTINLP
jgi:3-deoxy-D-manno-octulosonic-acid transferase